MRGVLIILIFVFAPLVLSAQTQTKGIVYYIDNKKADLEAVEAIPTGETEETVNLTYPDTKNYDSGDQDVMLVFTHKFAVSTYQKRIGAFSREYVDYLSTHKNSDKQVVYSVDGKLIAKDRGEALALFHIKSESIRSVTFGPGDGKKVSVNIITKR